MNFIMVGFFLIIIHQLIKCEKFLDKHKELFEKLADEHIKKD